MTPSKLNIANNKKFKRIFIEQANAASANPVEAMSLHPLDSQRSASIPFEQMEFDPQDIGPGKYQIDNQITQRAPQAANFGFHKGKGRDAKESTNPFIQELKQSVALKLHRSLNHSCASSTGGAAPSDLSHIDTLFQINQKLENPAQNIQISNKLRTSNKNSL